MRKIIMILVLGLFFVNTFSQEKNKKLSIKVHGKCEMCKVRIEKAAIETKGVKYAKWDIESSQLSFVFDERKTNPMQIKTGIIAVGHDTKELKATQEAYKSIHYCCRYRKDYDDSN